MSPTHAYKNPNLLAEFEEDLLKHQHRPCAAQDGERLSSKQGVGHACHGSSKQGLNRTLEGKQNKQTTLKEQQESEKMLIGIKNIVIFDMQH